MSREAHAGFYERRRVRLPPATHLVILVRGTKAQAQTLKEQTAEFMAEQMRLTLSPAPTSRSHQPTRQPPESRRPSPKQRSRQVGAIVLRFRRRAGE